MVAGSFVLLVGIVPATCRCYCREQLHANAFLQLPERVQKRRLCQVQALGGFMQAVRFAQAWIVRRCLRSIMKKTKFACKKNEFVSLLPGP